MIYGIRFVVKYLLGKDTAERNFAVYPDDTFIIAYPRSGSTWSRFLVSNLLHPDIEVSFANIDELLPATSSRSRRALKRMPRPRIIKSHNYFDHRYRNVIYIVRDPRDVVLSEYRFILKGRGIEDNYPIDAFVARFLKGEVSTYGSWKQNVGTWIAARGGSERFLLLRYEDLVAKTAIELSKIAIFLGIETTPERLTQATERSSAENLRSLEKTQGDAWVVTKGRRTDVPFVGRATSGVWKSTWSEACIAQIEKVWGPLMSSLGYELVNAEFGNAVAPDVSLSKRLYKVQF